MKTLYLATIIACITSLSVFGVYIVSNPTVKEVGQSESYTASYQGPPIINRIEINGLQQNYTVGEIINASVVYTGYYEGGVDPDVEILDPYGEKVWRSCCITHNETPTLSFGTSTFRVLEPVMYNGILKLTYPVFVSAGNYTMIASLDNGTVKQTFNIIDDTNMTYHKTDANEITYHDHQNPPQYSIVNATQGNPVENDSLASSMVGFQVSSPSYLPPGYQVRLIKVEKDLPLVTIFASKYPLSDKTTSTQFFWLDKGILITYSTASERELENINYTLFTPQANVVTIDGNRAMIDNIHKLDYHGHPYDMWASLAMLRGNVNIGVDGFLSQDEIVKVTESMLGK